MKCVVPVSPARVQTTSLEEQPFRAIS